MLTIAANETKILPGYKPVEVREFVVDDGEFIIPQALDVGVRDTEFWRQWCALNAAAGCAFTGVMDGEILCAGGIRGAGSGRGTAWAILPARAAKYKEQVYRTFREILRIAIELYGFTVIRATAKVKFPASQRFLQHLGFERIRKTVSGKDWLFRLTPN